MKMAERWLPIGLVLLLAVLGVLQYRWAGALGEAEKERMEAGLRSSLGRFSAEVEDELVGVFRSFRAESVDEVSRAYQAWSAREGSPSIIRDVYLVQSGETLEVPSDGSAPKRSDLSLSIGPRDFPLSRSPLGLVVPLGWPRESGQRLRPQAVVVAAIDREYLREEVIPRAASRHLGEYDVVILDETGVLWSSDGADVDATTRDPDAVHGLFDLSPFRRGGLPGTPGPHPDRGPRRRSRPRPEERAPGPGRPRPPTGPPPDGPFRVLVRHEAGSLQAAVDRARARNLGVGFGVLSVLAASILLLASSARRARRLSERQMEFVAGVSHELRTPVAVIRSAAQNLADGSVSDPVKVARYGTMLEGEARRLEYLVEEVLELAGIQSNKRQYAEERIVAADLVDAVLEQVESDAELELEGRPVATSVADEGLTVVGDPEALKRALSNLVRNAIKHAGAGSVELSVSRRGELVVFGVSDRGPGIPDEDRPHLFEAFYRGRRAREGQIPGSGLGLSLVSHIVRAHGGEVSATAREGGGTTFEIRLPETRGFE